MAKVFAVAFGLGAVMGHAALGMGDLPGNGGRDTDRVLVLRNVDSPIWEDAVIADPLCRAHQVRRDT